MALKRAARQISTCPPASTWLAWHSDRQPLGGPSHYRDVAPVDLLLACGIFGTISDDDGRRTVAALPSLLRPPTSAHPGGRVLWTEPGYHDAAGCHELTTFLGDGGSAFS